ncbi:MAG TPA: CBS domain-containing protein [Thermoplasmata archaeon]|nr:CBS domain-containing protein [Thermoplasmata archaeon]
MSPNVRRSAHRRRRTSAGRPRPRAASIPLPYNVAVGDVLSRPAVLIGTDASLFDALVLMRTHQISGLPVIDGRGTVVGVLSEKDLARVITGVAEYPAIRGLLDLLLVGVAGGAGDYFDRVRPALAETRVADAMSSPPIVIQPEAPLEFAMEVMRDREINRLPVVDRGCLIGVVSRHDVLRANLPGRATGRPKPSVARR